MKKTIIALLVATATSTVFLGNALAHGGHSHSHGGGNHGHSANEAIKGLKYNLGEFGNNQFTFYLAAELGYKFQGGQVHNVRYHEIAAIRGDSRAYSIQEDYYFQVWPRVEYRYQYGDFSFTVGANFSNIKKDYNYFKGCASLPKPFDILPGYKYNYEKGTCEQSFLNKGDFINSTYVNADLIAEHKKYGKFEISRYDADNLESESLAVYGFGELYSNGASFRTKRRFTYSSPVFTFGANQDHKFDFTLSHNDSDLDNPGSKEGINKQTLQLHYQHPSWSVFTNGELVFNYQRGLYHGNINWEKLEKALSSEVEEDETNAVAKADAIERSHTLHYFEGFYRVKIADQLTLTTDLAYQKVHKKKMLNVVGTEDPAQNGINKGFTFKAEYQPFKYSKFSLGWGYGKETYRKDSTAILEAPAKGRIEASDILISNKYLNVYTFAFDTNDIPTGFFGTKVNFNLEAKFEHSRSVDLYFTKKDVDENRVESKNANARLYGKTINRSLTAQLKFKFF